MRLTIGQQLPIEQRVTKDGPSAGVKCWRNRHARSRRRFVGASSGRVPFYRR
jgi:hypothetical protein